MECRFAGKTWVEWPSDGAEPCGHLRRWPRRRSRPHAVDRRAPLGNSIDIEVDDPILGQIALDKSLVLRPQPFGDLAHRRAREQPTPAFVRKRVLDVTGRQPARIKLDCQILESVCDPSDSLGSPRRTLRRVAHLRRRKLNRALRRLHPAGPVSISVALRFAVGPLVTLPANPVANLALQGFLQDQPRRRQQHQVGPLRRCKLLACLFGCGYRSGRVWVSANGRLGELRPRHRLPRESSTAVFALSCHTPG
jgi:hypothetical protein